jgi:hypothetical protein
MRISASQTHQKRSTAAAIGGRVGAVVVVGAVRGRRLHVPRAGLIPQLGDQDRRAGAVGRVLGAGRDHLDGLGLDSLVRSVVGDVAGLVVVAGAAAGLLQRNPVGRVAIVAGVRGRLGHFDPVNHRQVPPVLR